MKESDKLCKTHFNCNNMFLELNTYACSKPAYSFVINDLSKTDIENLQQNIRAVLIKAKKNTRDVQ